MVTGLISGLVGGIAEYALLDIGSAVVPPNGNGYVEAAYFPVAFQTSWFVLHIRGQVAAGAREVIGVVGSEAKRAAAFEAGRTAVLLRRNTDLVGQIKAVAGQAVDVVIDPVGGASHAISERVVGFGGRIVLVGFASGQIPPIRADLAMIRNYSVFGLHWGLYRDRVLKVARQQYRQLVRVVEEQAILPVVSRVFDFERAPEALIAVKFRTVRRPCRRRRTCLTSPDPRANLSDTTDWSVGYLRSQCERTPDRA